MKTLFIILIAAVIICACNDPKDPPDDDGTIEVDGDGIRVDTTKIVTKEYLQKVVDSLSNN